MQAVYGGAEAFCMVEPFVFNGRHSDRIESIRSVELLGSGCRSGRMCQMDLLCIVIIRTSLEDSHLWMARREAQLDHND